MTSLHHHQKPGLVLYKWYINLINSTLMIPSEVKAIARIRESIKEVIAVGNRFKKVV